MFAFGAVCWPAMHHLRFFIPFAKCSLLVFSLGAFVVFLPLCWRRIRDEAFLRRGFSEFHLAVWLCLFPAKLHDCPGGPPLLRIPIMPLFSFDFFWKGLIKKWFSFAVLILEWRQFQLLYSMGKSECHLGHQLLFLDNEDKSFFLSRKTIFPKI